MNVTFDTNVLLSSTLWDGSSSQKLLFKLIKSDSTIASSKEIIDEYQKVLKRDFDYTDEETANILKKVFEFITLVAPTEQINIIKEDSTDNRIIECAITAKSQYIITYDKHLLKIKEYKNIKILKPEELNQIMR